MKDVKLDIDLKKLNEEFNNSNQNNPHVFIINYLNSHREEIKNLEVIEEFKNMHSNMFSISSRGYMKDRSDLFRVKGEVLGALEALNHYLKDDQIKYNNELISKYKKIIDDEIIKYYNYIDSNFEYTSKDNDLQLYSNIDFNPDNIYINIENKLDGGGDLYMSIEGDSGFKGCAFLNKSQIQQLIKHLNGVISEK